MRIDLQHVIVDSPLTCNIHIHVSFISNTPVVLFRKCTEKTYIIFENCFQCKNKGVAFVSTFGGDTCDTDGLGIICQKVGV